MHLFPLILLLLARPDQLLIAEHCVSLFVFILFWCPVGGKNAWFLAIFGILGSNPACSPYPGFKLLIRFQGIRLNGGRDWILTKHLIFSQT